MFLKKHKFICSVAFAIQPLAFLLPFWSLSNISITLFCLVWRISILFNVSLLACLLCRCKLCQSSISEWCLLQKQTNKRIQQFMWHPACPPAPRPSWPSQPNPPDPPDPTLPTLQTLPTRPSRPSLALSSCYKASQSYVTSALVCLNFVRKNITVMNEFQSTCYFPLATNESSFKGRHTWTLSKWSVEKVL